MFYNNLGLDIYTLQTLLLWTFIPFHGTAMALRLNFFQTHISTQIIAVELQWLEHLWNHENMLETGVVRANEC